MARLIQKSGYIQGGRAARYMEYVAKRDDHEDEQLHHVNDNTM